MSRCRVSGCRVVGVSVWHRFWHCSGTLSGTVTGTVPALPSPAGTVPHCVYAVHPYTTLYATPTLHPPRVHPTTTPAPAGVTSWSYTSGRGAAMACGAHFWVHRWTDCWLTSLALLLLAQYTR